MKTKTLFGLVAVGLGLTIANSARAGWGVSVSIGLPVFCPPPVVCAPAPPVVYAPAPCPPPVYWPAPVVVAPRYPVYPAYRPVVMRPPAYGWYGHGHAYGHGYGRGYYGHR